MSNEETNFKLKSIYTEMNKEFTLDDFCDLLEKETNGRMTFTNLKDTLEKTYPKTNKQDKIFLLKQISLNIKTGLIHIFDLFEFISKNLNKKIVSPIFTFYLTARIIEKIKKMSTLEFIYKCGLILHSEININEFYKTITTNLDIDDLTSIILFKSLDYNKTGKIRVEDFIFLIDSYRDDILFEESSLKTDEKFQSELKNAKAKVKDLMVQNFLTSDEIFKRLVIKNFNYVEYNQLLQFMKNELNKENNFEIERMIEILLNSILKDDDLQLQSQSSLTQAKIFKEDFDNLFKDKSENNSTEATANVNENSKNANKSSLARIKLNDVQLYWINKYLLLLDSINLTDKMAYEAAKESKTNLLNLENLKRKLKLMLPVGKISAMELNSIIETLDINKKRLLTLTDYEEIVNAVKLSKIKDSNEKEAHKSEKSKQNFNQNYFNTFNSQFNNTLNNSQNKTFLNSFIKGVKSINYHLLPVKGNHKVVEQLKIEIGKNYNSNFYTKSINSNNNPDKESQIKQGNISENKLDFDKQVSNSKKENEGLTNIQTKNNFIEEKKLLPTNKAVDIIDKSFTENVMPNAFDEEKEEKNEALLIETFENFNFCDPNGFTPVYNLFDYLKSRLIDGESFTQKKISQIVRQIDKNKDGLITYNDMIEFLLYEYKHRSTKLAFKSMANKIHHESKLKTEDFFIQNGISETNKQITQSSLIEILLKLFQFESPISRKIYEEMRIVFSHRKNKLTYNDLIELIDEVKIEQLLKNELNSGKTFSNSISNMDLKQFEEGIRSFVHNLIDYNSNPSYSQNLKQLTVILRENLKCAVNFSNLDASNTMNLQQFKENFIKPLKMEINLGIAVFQLLKNFSHRNEQIITKDDLIFFLESYLENDFDTTETKRTGADISEILRIIENAGCPILYVFDSIPYNSQGIITCNELLNLLQDFYPTLSRRFLKYFIQTSELDSNRLGVISYDNLQNFLQRIYADNNEDYRMRAMNLEFKKMASVIDKFYENINVSNIQSNQHHEYQIKSALDFFTNLNVNINNLDSVKKQEHMRITNNLSSNKSMKEEMFEYLCSISGNKTGYSLQKLCEKIDVYRNQLDLIHLQTYNLFAKENSLDQYEINEIISEIILELSKDKSGRTIFDKFLENVKLGESGSISILEISQILSNSMNFLDKEKILKILKSLDYSRNGFVSFKDFHLKLKDYFGTKYLGNLKLNAKYIFSYYIQKEFDGNIEDFLMNKFSNENVNRNVLNTFLTKDNFSNYFLEYFMNDLNLFNQFFLLYKEKEGKNKDMMSLEKFLNYLKENNRDRIKSNSEDEYESELDEEIFHILNKIEETQIPLKNFFDFLSVDKISEIGGYTQTDFVNLIQEKLSVNKEDSKRILEMFSYKKGFNSDSNLDEVNLIKMADYILLNCEKSETKIEEIATKIKNSIKRYNITQYEMFLRRFSLQANIEINVKEIVKGFPSIFRISVFECFVLISHCRNILETLNNSNNSKKPKIQKITIEFIFDTLNIKEIFIYKSQIQTKSKDSNDFSIDSSLKLSLMKLNEFLEKEPDKVKSFQSFDVDRNGVLSTEEFLNALNSFKDLRLNDSQKISLLKVADKNKDGNINYNEFISFLKFIKNEMERGNDPNTNKKISRTNPNPNDNRKNSFMPKIEIDYKKFKINFENNLRRIDPKTSDKFSNLLFILQEDFFVNFNNFDNIEKDFNSIDENQIFTVEQNDFIIVLKKRLLRMDADTINKFIEFSKRGLNEKEIKKLSEDNKVNYKNFLMNLSSFKYVPNEANIKPKHGATNTTEKIRTSNYSMKTNPTLIPPPNPPKKIGNSNANLGKTNSKFINNTDNRNKLQKYDEFEDDYPEHKNNDGYEYDYNKNNSEEKIIKTAKTKNRPNISQMENTKYNKDKLIKSNEYDEYADYDQDYNHINTEEKDINYSENMEELEQINQANSNDISIKKNISSLNKKKLEEQAKKEQELAKNKKDVKLKSKNRGNNSQASAKAQNAKSHSKSVPNANNGNIIEKSNLENKQISEETYENEEEVKEEKMGIENEEIKENKINSNKNKSSENKSTNISANLNVDIKQISKQLNPSEEELEESEVNDVITNQVENPKIDSNTNFNKMKILQSKLNKQQGNQKDKKDLSEYKMEEEKLNKTNEKIEKSEIDRIKEVKDKEIVKQGKEVKELKISDEVKNKGEIKEKKQNDYVSANKPNNKRKLTINKQKTYDFSQFEQKVDTNEVSKVFLGNIGLNVDLSDTQQLKNLHTKMSNIFACNLKANNFNENANYTDEMKQNFKYFLSKLNNIDYKGYEYILKPNEDYFMRYGTEPVETILNSEDAAIKKCEDIWNSINEGEKFFDKDFGSQPKDNGLRNKLSLYITGVSPKGGLDPQLIEWYSMSKIFSETKAKFIDDGVETNDVMQGALGDCWFISALAVIATKPHLLHGEFNPKILQDGKIDSEENVMLSTGVYPPIFHSFGRKGIFCFRFYKDFKWRYVIIDDRLPCKRVYSKIQEPKLLYGKCRNESEFWVPLIEKAYAKLHGSYEALISGFIDDGLVDLTGLVARKYIISQDERKNSKNIDNLWKIIKTNCNEQFENEVITDRAGRLSKSKLFSLNDTMMGCSIDAKVVESEVVYQNQKCGILAGHAYSILDAFEIPKPNGQKSRKTSRLLRIKNPWGFKEWNGKWNDESEEIEKNKELIQNYLITKYSETNEKINLNQEDGTFIMCFKDFRNLFGKLFICYDFPQSIIGIRFFDKWTVEQSGGLPLNNTDKEFKAFAKNPQYYLNLNNEAGIFISLLQKDGRLTKSKFPYPEVTRKACIIIMKTKDGKKRLNSFDNDLTVEITPIRQHREISVYIILPPGEYLIIPSVMKEGETGDFCLELYFPDKIKNSTNPILDRLTINKIEKLGIPAKCELITENRVDHLDQVKKIKEQFIYSQLLNILRDSDEAEPSNANGKSSSTTNQNNKKGKNAPNEEEDDWDEY